MRRLREIAEAATPGPWDDPAYDDAPGDRGWYVLNGKGGMQQHAVAVTCPVWSDRALNDAEHIATFDPPTVLALLDVVEAAEARNEHDVVAALARLREVSS